MLKNLAYFGLFVGGVGLCVVGLYAVIDDVRYHIDNRKAEKRRKMNEEWPSYEEYAKEMLEISVKES